MNIVCFKHDANIFNLKLIEDLNVDNYPDLIRYIILWISPNLFIFKPANKVHTKLVL